MAFSRPRETPFSLIFSMLGILWPWMAVSSSSFGPVLSWAVSGFCFDDMKTNDMALAGWITIGRTGWVVGVA